MTLENEDVWIPREHSTVSRLFDNKPFVANQFKTLLIYYYKTRKHESWNRMHAEITWNTCS